MANTENKHTLLQERRALDLVDEWLHVESLARPRRRHGLHPNSAYSKASAVYNNQIPKKMEAFQQHINALSDNDRDETTALKLGRSILEAASLAQHGFLLGKINRNNNIITAMDESWHVLQSYKKHVRLNHLRLPDVQKLQQPFQEAIEEYTAHPYGHQVHTYIGMVAFSASVVVKLRDLGNDQYLLPSPGLAPEILERWDYSPQLVPKKQLAE